MNYYDFVFAFFFFSFCVLCHTFRSIKVDVFIQWSNLFLYKVSIYDLLSCSAFDQRLDCIRRRWNESTMK